MSSKEIVKCCACGTPCKIVGKTTMHYEPVWKEENAVLRKQNIEGVKENKRLRKVLRIIAKEEDFPSCMCTRCLWTRMSRKALEGK